jgi:hypothetical protein
MNATSSFTGVCHNRKYVACITHIARELFDAEAKLLEIEAAGVVLVKLLVDVVDARCEIILVFECDEALRKRIQTPCSPNTTHPH